MSPRLGGFICANDGVNSSEQMMAWISDDETDSPVELGPGHVPSLDLSVHPSVVGDDKHYRRTL